MNNQVIVVKTNSLYPAFPYPDDESSLARTLTYLFSLWGKDPLNPFKDWISPGGCVLIKPNWVLDYNSAGHNLESLITHSSLIKYLIDFIALALEGKGKIIIGDAPIQACNFNRLIQVSRIQDTIQKLKERYPEIEIIPEDWRLTIFNIRKSGIEPKNYGQQHSVGSFGNDGSENHRLIDMGKLSFLEEIAQYSDRFRVAMYNPCLMADHHRLGKHEYIVTKRIFEADLLINLPKMKTHSKAGLTGALKNLVGINGHKEYLPHHIKGSYFNGGDNYCTSSRLQGYYENFEDHLWKHYTELSPARRQIYLFFLKALWKFSKILGFEGISTGGWSGNDTIWRMTLDLNHLLYFNEKSPCKVITIVDGIIAGEGEGPLTPAPKSTGLLIGGENPAYIDAVIGKLMGYNIARIPTVYQAIYNRKSKFGGQQLESLDVTCLFNGGTAEVIPFDRLPNLKFLKPKYWERADAIMRE
jgi:uncharacterized protein (DUF362 family)